MLFFWLLPTRVGWDEGQDLSPEHHWAVPGAAGAAQTLTRPHGAGGEAPALMVTLGESRGTVRGADGFGAFFFNL